MRLRRLLRRGTDVMRKAMGEPADKLQGFGPKLRFAGLKFRAWWDGDPFDAEAARAACLPAPKAEPEEKTETPAEEPEAAPADAKPPRLDDAHVVAEMVWGDGWMEPGAGKWIQSLARRLKLEDGAAAVVFGGGFGGPAADLAGAFDWRVAHYSDLRQTRRDGAPKPYEALADEPPEPAAGALSIFDLHRAPEIGLRARMLADVLAPGAGAVVVDYTSDAGDELIEDCFAAPWGGRPYRALKYEWAFGEAGLKVTKAVDETAAVMRLVASGWERWKTVYDAIAEGETDAGVRAERLRALAEHARLWAARFDALQSGALGVTRFHVEPNDA